MEREGSADWSGQGPSAATSGSISLQEANTVRQAEGQSCPGGISPLSPATVSALLLHSAHPPPPPPPRMWDESA